MKKIFIFLICFIILSGCNKLNEKKVETQKTANFSDEMKFDDGIDISVLDGSDSVERKGDHPDSIYFAHPDFYNMESTDTLTILPKFKTLQQSSEWSCGVASATMILKYFDRLGDSNELSLAHFRTNKKAAEATSLKSMIKIFEGVGGFKIESTYDYSSEEAKEKINLEMIQNYLKQGIPVAVAWNDFGGHWQIIIGYDTMGTETVQDDVIIVADPYDSTDHNQDGYGIYPAERFYYNWTMYDFFTKNYEINERDLLFIAVKPLN